MILLRDFSLDNFNNLYTIQYLVIKFNDPISFFLQLAAELRIPVKGTHVYAFAEHGNDLGSSKAVKGNPTEVYRRMGHGSSYGVGLKLGLVRAEYAVDHNSGTGALFFRFGERF